MEILQAPRDFVWNFLSKLGAPIDGIADVHHWRSPKLSPLTRRYSFKIFEYENLKEALEEQNIVELKKEVFFINGKESQAPMYVNSKDTAEDILVNLASQSSLDRPRQSRQRSSFVVRGMEGRSSREVECIWYPELYTEGVHYGKLEIRIFASKVREI